MYRILLSLAGVAALCGVSSALADPLPEPNYATRPQMLAQTYGAPVYDHRSQTWYDPSYQYGYGTGYGAGAGTWSGRGYGYNGWSGGVYVAPRSGWQQPYGWRGTQGRYGQYPYGGTRWYAPVRPDDDDDAWEDWHEEQRKAQRRWHQHNSQRGWVDDDD